MAEIIGMALHLVNMLLLFGLLFIYVQNYRHLRTKLTAGLVLFASLFLLQSIVNIYYDATMVMYSSAGAETAAAVIEAIKAVGFAVLLWISWE